MNLANVSKLASNFRPTSASGTWYRALDLRWLPTALQTTHTRTTRSRFNAGPSLPLVQQFSISYLCDNSFVAQHECGALFG